MEDNDYESEHQGSFDVLLQLTLPMVLILALLVVTEVQTLQEHINQLMKDIEDTPTGVLLQQRNEALLTLQQQLLWKAIEEVMEEVVQESGVLEYVDVCPSALEVIEGHIETRFKEISTVVAQRFNGQRSYAKSRIELRRRILERFRQLALEVLGQSPDISGSGARTLLELSKKNSNFLETELAGHLEDQIGRLVEVQLQLALDWLQESRASELVKSESSRLWSLIQTISEPDPQIDQFVNLKVSGLEQRLEELDVPLLDETWRQIL